MRLSTSAARALIELKEARDALARQRDDDVAQRPSANRYSSSGVDLRFSSQLTGDHAARILDASPIAHGLLDTGVPKPGRNTYYLLAVRRIGGDEQCLHPKPLRSTKGWFRHFLHTPLFQRFNLVHEPGFPKLEPPAGQAPWSTARFFKNGAEYMAIATVALSKAPLTQERDTVVFHLYSPALPNDHASLIELGKHSSHARRSVATHVALSAMALAQGMTELPGDAAGDDDAHPVDHGFEHGDALGADGRFERLHLEGAFHSYEREASSGSAVVPLTMRHCFFLGPALSAAEAVDYDILQPHRYAYLFRIRFLAGWELLGAVNLHVDTDRLRHAWPKTTSDLDANRLLLVANPERWAANLESSRQLHALLAQARETNLDAFRQAMITHVADPAIRVLVGADTQPSVKLPTTDAEKAALPHEVWRRLMCATRLDRMQEALHLHLSAMEQRAYTALGDRFLRGDPTLSTDALLTVLYEALHGLAELVLPDDQDDARSVGHARTAVAEPALTLKTLAPRAGVSLLLGKAPRQWAHCALALGDPSLDVTLRYICQNPDEYAALLLLSATTHGGAGDEALLPTDPAFWTKAWLRHEGLAKARLDAKWCLKRVKSRPSLNAPEDAPARLAKRRNALVYYLFSRDARFKYDTWL